MLSWAFAVGESGRSPGQVAAQPRDDGHRQDEERENPGDQRDQVDELGADEDERLAGTAERRPGDVADALADKRHPFEG